VIKWIIELVFIILAIIWGVSILIASDPSKRIVRACHPIPVVADGLAWGVEPWSMEQAETIKEAAITSERWCRTWAWHQFFNGVTVDLDVPVGTEAFMPSESPARGGMQSPTDSQGAGGQTHKPSGSTSENSEGRLPPEYAKPAFAPGYRGR